MLTLIYVGAAAKNQTTFNERDVIAVAITAYGLAQLMLALYALVRASNKSTVAEVGAVIKNHIDSFIFAIVISAPFLAAIIVRAFTEL